MARNTPCVDGTVLVGRAGAASSIAVGSPAWYAWLEEASTFAFRSAEGGFTARKERRGQSGWYWKAYRKHEGALYRAYLGKSADLTLDRLTVIASELAGRATGPLPRESPSVVSLAQAAADGGPALLPTAPLPVGTLTFCFTDIAGSTQLWEQYPRAMPAALARHDAIVREAIHAHRGVVFKTVGDGAHAVFATAPDALAAALACQRALHAEPWGSTGPLHVRMALHTGVATARDGNYYGAPLNRVARILAAGHGGQILLSLATEELVRDHLPAGATLRDLGIHQLKDLRHAEQIFQLVSSDLPADFAPLHISDALPAPQPAPALPLLTTKLFVPPARANLVARPRLVERFESGLRGKLTLICAPAGFGKTTLVSAWRANPAGSAIALAWVALDAGDSDPPRFWRYLIAALDMLVPDIGAAALALLEAPQPPPIETILPAFLNALNAMPTEMMLVLDDYHVIDTPAIHSAFAFLLDHLPPRLHLVVTTRADPPLPLARLRARGELTELRADDLRFTSDEAAAFLTTVMQLPLATEQIAALELRTEGWIAGLQFAALAMRDHRDIAGFINAFTGSNRFVVDYLAEEVLNHLPHHLQTFLLQTAVVDRMCASLCDMLILGAQPDPHHAASQALLEELERANLFIVPLDDTRQWYRYHHLFAEVLRGRLTSGAMAESVATLHRRASAWFEQRELVPEAIQHALAAHDWARAADVIEQHGQSLMFRGQVHTVVGWMNRLAAPLVRARPGLCVIYALSCMFTNDLSAAEAPLQYAEQWIAVHAQDGQTQTIRGWVAAIRASILRIRGDLAGCVELSQQTADLLPETELIGAAARVNLVHAYLVSGDVRPANEHLVAAAVATARASGNMISILRSMTLLARLQVLQGRLQAAESTYTAAAQIAPGQDGLQALVNSAAYYSGMGDLLREQNDLTAAARYLELGMDRVREILTVDAHVVWRGYLAQARLEQVTGNGSAALATLEQFEQLAHERSYAPALVARAAAARARLWLMQGNRAAAMGWMERSGLGVDDAVSFPRESEYVMLARVLIAQGSHKPALGLLDRLLAAAEQGARMHSVIEIVTVRALAWQAHGELHAALTDLEWALTLAAPEGYVRLFVDEGASMAALLRAAHQHGIAPAYVARLLDAFPSTEGRGSSAESLAPARSVLSPQSSTLVEPLSDRELDVLRLIADGHSNQAIADQMVVAVSTVKKHINNLYGKLDVQSRTQALARAHDLNLL